MKRLFVVRTRAAVPQPASPLGPPLRRRLPPGLAALAAARRRRRSPAARGRAPPHRDRFRSLVEPSGSSPRHPAVRALLRRRAARPRSDGCALDRRLWQGSVSRVELPSAARRDRALRAADPVRQRTRPQRREGQSRSGAADRGDPAAPRIFPRGVFRAALGTAQGNPQQRDSRRPAAGLGATFRAANMCCRFSPASRWRWRCSCSRRISAPRSSSAASSWRCTRWRGGGWRCRSPASRCCWLAFTSDTSLHVSRTLSERVRMWQSPWDNSAAGGDQVAQAIWAMAIRRRFGHRPRAGRFTLPAGWTHRPRPRRGRRGAGGRRHRCARGHLRADCVARVPHCALGVDRLRLLPRTALTLFLIVPALVMAAGVVGVIPLTGVVTPFLSYGGSAMVANFAALGILSSIQADKRPAVDFGSFDVPLRWVSGALGVAALALVAVAFNIQVVHADDYVGPAAPRCPGRRRPPLRLQPARAGRGAADPARHGARPARSAARDRRSRAARTRTR